VIDLSDFAFVLVATGSGMSADAGLMTYDDVEKSGQNYRDLSSTTLLAKAPQQFAAWAERCVQVYRAAPMHDGYALLTSMSASCAADPRNAQLCADLHNAMASSSRAAQLDAARLPGRVFFATTNVDSMFRRAGVDAVDLCELHGSYERWQCSGLAIPSDGLAPFVHFGAVCCADTWALDDDWRPTGTLPLCKWCGVRPARPAVYHFGDGQFVGAANEANFVCWVEAVCKLRLPVLLLEIGVGLRLPRLRRVMGDIRGAVGDAATHIRVNPKDESPEPGVRHVQQTALSALTALLQSCSSTPHSQSS